MNKWAELLLGLILVIAAVLVVWFSGELNWGNGLWNFRHSAWEFLKGGVAWVAIGAGLLFIMLGLSDLKE